MEIKTKTNIWDLNKFKSFVKQRRKETDSDEATPFAIKLELLTPFPEMRPWTCFGPAGLLPN